MIVPWHPYANSVQGLPMAFCQPFIYRETSNISQTSAGNKIVDHPDVVGASPVGAAPPTSLFSI